MLNTARPSLRMLALRKSAFTPAGDDQSAATACRYHANAGSRAPACAEPCCQNAFNVDRAMTRMAQYSPELGLMPICQQVFKEPAREQRWSARGRASYARRSRSPFLG